MKWSYGVTTVPGRIHSGLLERTLNSLITAGFGNPWLFVDGKASVPNYHVEGVTMRDIAVRTAGNWILSLYEMYARNPNADRYAVFQDDFVTYKNLRQYLNQTTYPERGYLNLITIKSNEAMTKTASIGFHQAGLVDSGDFQTGRGAVALVFDNQACMTILSSQNMVERFKDSSYGHRRVDGGIVLSMNKVDWREYIHNPSLIQHTGDLSSMGNPPHGKALTFRGEDFDAMRLLEEVCSVT